MRGKRKKKKKKKENRILHNRVSKRPALVAIIKACRGSRRKV